MPDEEGDDLWVDSTQQELAPNTRCPLSFRALLELKEPVKCAAQRSSKKRRRARVNATSPRCRDSKGYVYEREAIMAVFKKSRANVVPSPNAGVQQGQRGLAHRR